MFSTVNSKAKTVIRQHGKTSHFSRLYSSGPEHWRCSDHQGLSTGGAVCLVLTWLRWVKSHEIWYTLQCLWQLLRDRGLFQLTGPRDSIASPYIMEACAQYIVSSIPGVFNRGSATPRGSAEVLEGVRQIISSETDRNNCFLFVYKIIHRLPMNLHAIMSSPWQYTGVVYALLATFSYLVPKHVTCHNHKI